MFLASSVHQTVAFVGFRDKNSGGGIRCEGTAFFLVHEGAGYLVTARHVAENLGAQVFDLGSDPFVIRLNRRNGDAELYDINEPVRWYPHEDKSVDVAVMPFELNYRAGFEVQYILSEDSYLVGKNKDAVEVGNICYTVGLFRFIYGNKRSFPLVHTGNLALLPPPGERIPIWDKNRAVTEHAEGYLIESRALDGASGSPVFVRPAWRIGNFPLEDGTEPLVAATTVMLLGLYQGAWFLPPDAVLAEGVKARPNDIVPVGIGVVVPATKIVELLKSEPLKALRVGKPPFLVRPPSSRSERA